MHIPECILFKCFKEIFNLERICCTWVKKMIFFYSCVRSVCKLHEIASNKFYIYEKPYKTSSDRSSWNFQR